MSNRKSGYGIKVTLQPSGALLFQADNKTRSDLAASLRDSWDKAESDFVEMIRGEYINGEAFGVDYCYTLEWLNPADIFALTEMPMLADNCRDGDDSVRVYGPVWGFPDYCIRSYLAELAHRGRVEFSIVTDFDDGIAFPSRWKDKAEAERLAVAAFKHCIDRIMVTEQVPDLHGDPGDTIARLVDFAPRPPAPAVADLFEGRAS